MSSLTWPGPAAAPPLYSPVGAEREAQVLDDSCWCGRRERFLEHSTLPRDRVHVRLLQGVPGEQIVHRAQKRAADLIVMGTHGWSGVVRWMLGSVAHHVIQAAPCPVLTVSPIGTPQAARVRATPAESRL
jgi:hypothetical protein